MESGRSFESTMARSDAAPEAKPKLRNPEEHKLFAKANIERLMRRVLPPDMMVSEDAKDMMQVNLTEFIRLVTNEANERCRSECRSTITVENVLSALAALGFDDYLQPLCLFMNKYREQDPGRHGSRGVYEMPRMVAPPGYYADREVPPRVDGGGRSSGGPSSQVKYRD